MKALRPWIAPIALVLLTILALCAGRYPISLGELWSALNGQGDTAAANVLWQIRLPRVLGGLAVGAALAAAGATYQGLFRNPLVSPDILGVTGGASLGAVLGIYFGLPIVGVQLTAFLGGLGAVALVYVIGARLRAYDPLLVLVLSGVAVGALLSAGVSLIKVLADPYEQLPAITYWLLGSLASVTRGDVAAAAPAMLIGLVPMALLRWRMNIMSLDDDEARALGLNTKLLRGALIVGATLATAAAVSIAGVVGWVGLLIPHIARLIVGPDFTRLLPASIMLGGGFLIAIDVMARSIAPTEIPLGVLTAAIGAPFFLYLLGVSHRGWR